MRTRIGALVAVAAFVLASVVLAQPVEPPNPPLVNWTAPPYWTPTRATPQEGQQEHGTDVQALGVQVSALSLPSAPVPFIAIAPCRIVDTRVSNPDGFHEPNFSDNETRTYTLPNSTDCPGLPTTSVAYSLNVQFRTISQAAYVTLYPAGTSRPLVSTTVGNTASFVADAAIVPAGTGGAIDVYCQYAGRVVIDINGYYEPGDIVNSLNTLTGDVTLSAGSNVTITPGGNTLTIAATGGPGGVLPTGSTTQTLYNNGSAWTASSALTNDGTNVGISGNLSLPNTTASTGQIAFGGNPFLHNFGIDSTFVGNLAGNFSMTGAFNTGIGFGSLSKVSMGSGNTGVGAAALFNDGPGSFNTAVGTGALVKNTSSSHNTAVGVDALASQSLGGEGYEAYPGDNTAVGFNGLHDNAPDQNATGYGNTAVGSHALEANTTGSENTAIGLESLFQSTIGVDNTAMGSNSLSSNSTGERNTAVGDYSLQSNTTGSFNTAVGGESLNHLTTGFLNLALGFGAGNALTTGWQNIYIANPGESADAGTIRIGFETIQDRAFIAGVRGTTTGNQDAVAVLIDSNGQLGTLSSSLRFKQDVADMGDASSRLLELRPVTFHYKTHPEGRLQYGLIAEEVNEVMPELVVRDATGQIESVAYHELPAMLLNELQKQRATFQAQITDQALAIQEQQATIQAHQAEIGELKVALAELNGLKMAVEELRRQARIQVP